MPELADLPGMTTGAERWFVPCGWGYYSVLYRTDLVEPREQSWNLLWDERYAGRLANGTEMDGAVIPAAMLLGVSDPYAMTDDEITRVKALLAQQRPLLHFYWSDPNELEQAIAAGEVVAAYAWGGSAWTLKAQGVPVGYMQPREGVLVWIDGFIWLKDGAGDEQHVHNYIDAWLAPETGEFLLSQYGYGHSNRKSFERVPPERLVEIGISSPAELLARGIFLREMDPALREKYVTMYEEVRAGF